MQYSKHRILLAVLIVLSALAAFSSKSHAECFLGEHDDVVCDRAAASNPQTMTGGGGSTGYIPGIPPIASSGPIMLPDGSSSSDQSCSGGDPYQQFAQQVATREGRRKDVYLDSQGN